MLTYATTAVQEEAEGSLTNFNHEKTRNERLQLHVCTAEDDVSLLKQEAERLEHIMHKRNEELRYTLTNTNTHTHTHTSGIRQ